MRQFLLQDHNTLPLGLAPNSRQECSRDLLVRWIEQNRQVLTEMLRNAGAVLFRGFDLSTAADFELVVRAYQPKLQTYIEGQSQRERVSGQVYTSTSYPAGQTITLHNELSYVADPPRNIVFFCVTPPTEMGETPIVDGRTVLQRFSARVLETFRGRGILYVKNMHAGSKFGFGKSWQEHFESEDRAVVEHHLEAANTSYEWLANGVLRCSQVRPAITTHPETGEEIWFNQASLWHISNLGRFARQALSLHGEANLATHAFFDNGEPIDDASLEEVRRVMWREATFFPWQRGDTLFVDNYLVAHGRNRYSGPRSILVALA